MMIITVTIDCRSNHVVVFALNQMRIAVGWPDDGLVPDRVPLMRMRMMVMVEDEDYVDGDDEDEDDVDGNDNDGFVVGWPHDRG